jgi:molybdopterin/thiamine biosynthesis adenylyltransferase
MGSKCVILLVLFMHIAQIICDDTLPTNAIRKYSFVYISVTFFTAILRFEMACVKQRTFISEMSSYTLEKLFCVGTGGFVIVRLRY